MKKTLKKAMALMLCLSVAASSVAAAEITAPAVADTADVYQTQDDGKINNQKTDEKETESESETGTVTGPGGVTVITPPSSEPETEPQKPSEPETDTPPSSEPETEPQKPSEPQRQSETTGIGPDGSSEAPPTEPPIEPTTEMPEPSTEPTSEFPTEPTTEPSTEPSTEPVTEPPTESEPDSETESETETEKVNKEKLQELLQEAAKIASEHMNNPVEELTDASFKELVLAGSNASGVYKEGSSTQEEVDAAANWLELAIRTRQLLRTISAQKLKATLDSLQTEVDMVNYTIRKGMPIKYASAAWEQFADLFEATQYFYEQHCAGNGNYVEAKVIDATHSKLISSYVALQRKTTGSSGKKDTGSKNNASSDELLDNLQDTLETINKGEYQETALEILLTALESEKKVSSEFAAGLRKLMGVLNFAKLMKDSNDAYDAHVPYEVNPKLYDWVNEHLIPTEVVPGTTENLNTIMKGLENKSRQSKDIMKTFDSEGEIKLPEYAIGDASREYINNN